MTNETMIEALEFGLIVEKSKKEFHLSCSHLLCKDCKFEYLAVCDFVLSKENFEFLKENYPEYVLKM